MEGSNDDPIQSKVLDFIEEAKKHPPKVSTKKWTRRLQRNYRGDVLPTLANVVTILQNEEKWQGVFSWDLHAGRVRKEKGLPAHISDAPAKKSRPTPFLEDADIDLTQVWLERMHEMQPSASIVARGIQIVARNKARHPVCEYLEGLEWDKTPRIDTWLTDFVAVDDAPHVRQMGAKWLISAVARVFEPGCQVDHVLIIEGAQRGGKSSAVKALCRSPEWFLSTVVELGNKDAYQVISSKWIVEFAELGSISKAESNKVKAFVTGRIDSYRKAYGRENIDQQRQCVFVGTVNPGAGAGYLKDETGGERWWVVFSRSDIFSRLDIGKLEAAREQIWAEAYSRYKGGERWYIEDPETLATIREEQDARRIQDPVEEKAERFLRSPRVYDEGASVRDLCVATGLDPDDIPSSMRAARILSALKWELAKRASQKGVRKRIYMPTSYSPLPIALGQVDRKMDSRK